MSERLKLGKRVLTPSQAEVRFEQGDLAEAEFRAALREWDEFTQLGNRYKALLNKLHKEEGIKCRV